MTTIHEQPRPVEPQFDVPGLLRRARRLADLSQRDLAERAGLSPSTVAKAELGAGTSFETMLQLFAAAGVHLVARDQDGQTL